MGFWARGGKERGIKAAAVACGLQGMGELANAPWPPIREVGRSLARVTL